MLLKVRNLSKSFQNGTKAIEDLSFNIPAGKITTFLGFNGAGKTDCGTLRYLQAAV